MLHTVRRSASPVATSTAQDSAKNSTSASLCRVSSPSIGSGRNSQLAISALSAATSAAHRQSSTTATSSTAG